MKLKTELKKAHKIESKIQRLAEQLSNKELKKHSKELDKILNQTKENKDILKELITNLGIYKDEKTKINTNKKIKNLLISLIEFEFSIKDLYNKIYSQKENYDLSKKQTSFLTKKLEKLINKKKEQKDLIKKLEENKNFIELLDLKEKNLSQIMEEIKKITNSDLAKYPYRTCKIFFLRFNNPQNYHEFGSKINKKRRTKIRNYTKFSKKIIVECEILIS
ncbi:hypothetical protein C9439_07605 [archaeon SCG-AAA382B04]|nr:hypothetical protein C9439_07605 [archaeon SCG-AAA382B04]